MGNHHDRCAGTTGDPGRGCSAGESSGRSEVPGGQIYYLVRGSEGGVPLLTIHGGPGSTHDCLRPLDGLSEERPVIFYDQLGSGLSDQPQDLSLWRVERFVDEVEYLRRAMGLSQVHILGHSWGTIVAAEYALRQPFGLRSLILASPVLSAHRWQEDATVYRGRLPEDVKETLSLHEAAGTTDSREYQEAAAVFYQRHLCRLDPWPDVLVHSMDQMALPVYNYMWGPSEFTATGTLAGYDCTHRLPEISVPTLFTCGAHDEATPATTRFYKDLVPGAELVVLEDSSHMPHLEETERYLEAIGDFLRRND